MELLIQYGHLGLFLASFLAATILPFSSEVVLGVLLVNGLNPAATVLTATSGNVLGAVVNYGLGLLGSGVVFKRILRLSEPEIQQAEKRFKTYGVFSLLFAWVPVIGDPLTVVAGLLRINFPLFLLLVTLGKGIRYLLIAWAVFSV